VQAAARSSAAVAPCRIARPARRRGGGGLALAAREPTRGGQLMPHNRFTVAAVTAACALTACATEPLTTEPQEVVAPARTTFYTEADDVARFRGYNEVYDITTNTCLKTCGEADNAPQVDSDESAVSIQFISSASEIARNAMFSLDANIELALHAGNVDVNASMKLASQSKFSTHAVRMLMVAHRTFKVVHNEAVELDPAKVDVKLLKWSEAGGDEDKFADRLTTFIGRCGHVYAKSIRHGAYLFALYEFSSTDASKLQNLEAKLGVAFKSHVGKLGGGVNAAAQTELSEALNGVRWEVKVIAKGFKINNEAGEGEAQIALTNGGAGGIDLQRIIGFFDAMQKSVDLDMKAIQLNSQDHPRSVFPIGLGIGRYADLLTGVPDEDKTKANTFMSNIMDAHDQLLQKYGALVTGMMAGHLEVLRFMALGEDQEKYQVMKWGGAIPFAPATKLRDNGNGLADRVGQYVTALDSRSPGSKAEALSKRVQDCWRWGRSGDLKRCLPKYKEVDQAIAADPAFQHAKTQLKSYNDTDRPVQLQYYFPPKFERVKRSDAPGKCGAERMPTLDESNAMGLVAYHRVPRFFGGARSFWVSDDGCMENFPHTFRFFDGEAYSLGCAKSSHKEPTVCVYRAGLFPAPPPKLYPAGGF
jgi:hypothetical protein